MTCILTITNHLGSDIHIIPTTVSLTAQKLAELFFKEWYCKNSLPLEIILDCNKLFVSQFWQSLHQLIGVKLKLSSSFHPESDGASEHTNKMVIQSIHFAVECNQKGWACALPKTYFNIINTINSSTRFTPFQLQFRKSPCILPPILLPPPENSPALTSTHDHMQHMLPLELEAKDNLLTTKIRQANVQNSHCCPEFPFCTRQYVVLSIANRRYEYKSNDSKRVAKFMPQFDGPYTIISTNKHHSTVMLDLLNTPNTFPVFHISKICPFLKNNNKLFPDQALNPPDPVLIQGKHEFFINKIINEQ